jgi:hypothetical protein
MTGLLTLPEISLESPFNRRLLQLIIFVKFQAYYKFMVEAAVYFGANKECAYALTVVN